MYLNYQRDLLDDKLRDSSNTFITDAELKELLPNFGVLALELLLSSLKVSLLYLLEIFS